MIFLDRTNPNAPHPSNEQIAHDLTIAWLERDWSVNRKAYEDDGPKQSVKNYMNMYKNFYHEVNKYHF